MSKGTILSTLAIVNTILCARSRIFDSNEVRCGPDWVSRRVGASGVVSVAWKQINVGKHRAGHNVGIQIAKGLVQIWDGPELIKSALLSRPGEVIRKKNAPLQPLR